MKDSMQDIIASAEELPFVGGTWEIILTFNEIRVDTINACQGPFPYQYRYLVDVWQKQGKPEIRWCYKGVNCLTSYDIGTLTMVTPNPFAETPLCQGGLPCLQNGRHVYDILPNCQFDAPCNSKNDPQRSTLFSDFQIPKNSPRLWGLLCRFYDYAETASRGGYVYYNGAWRHMNETWLFVKDITTCSGYSSNKKLMDSCNKENNFDLTKCDYKLVGATGGVVVYPQSTTGLPYVDGQPEMCWHYANIEGSRTRDFNAMMKDHPDWALF
ncbi:hypothetical protein GUITHDRAFT_122114 [Guillardia theta CCMP2712]|uniref:Uncharacterized protein n=1 Tax=Guillardia theta (strain CCMP2712) TaxID=905079 RepID=L1I6I9_GUITC|nr:hypothetical protein GUITHDRAFT_122114 [Guillardia theta CCMP2712]EKX31702.1 hypothetical protein GUITHDRAFT_122114 [Guillardia theta CCMP2712]|eukprot:XP_005818682.1 hypothetical protein GUITHDRAFT_122114 [Guillardia theta CCMP2712]